MFISTLTKNHLCPVFKFPEPAGDVCRERLKWSCHGGSSRHGKTWEDMSWRVFPSQLEISCEQKTGFDCLIFTKWRGRLRWTCQTQQVVSQRCEKLRIFLLFSQRNILLPSQRVLHVKTFLQLVSKRLLRDKLQEKLPRVTWPSILSFCYIRIFISVRQHNARVTANQEFPTTNLSQACELKMPRIMFAVVLGFFICWLPVFIIDIVANNVRHWIMMSRYAAFIPTYLELLSSTLNAWTISLMNRTFRKEIGILPCHHSRLSNE